MFYSKSTLHPLAILCAIWITGCLASAETAPPLLWLPLNEGKGSFTDDQSPNRREIELTNVDWVRGKFGTAARFRGENSFIDLPAIQGLSGASEFSLSLWVMWENAGSRYPNLLSSSNWNPGGLLLFVSDDSCSFRMGTNDGASGAWKETGVTLLNKLPQRQWTHLCVTFSKPEIKTYVNGKLVGQGKWDHLPKVEELRLGGWQSNVSHRGLLDDIRIDGRALSAEEVEKIATEESRKNEEFEQIEDFPGKKFEAAAQFDNGQAVLSIDDSGRAVSLREKKSGGELLSRPTSLVSVATEDGKIFTARKVTKQGNDLIFHFTRGGHAVIGIESMPGFYTFSVRSLDFPGASKLTFCQLDPAMKKYVGQMANMLSDDEFAMCLRGYELPVEMSVSGKGLSAGTTRAHGLTGWSAGLSAGAKKDMPMILRAMAERAGVPTSDVCGPWSLGAEANRGSYLFADLSHASTDDWIELAKRGGFTTIHLHGWWKNLGHYEPNPGYFPKGMDDLLDTVQRIKKAGLRVGMHTLTGCIDPRDSWITPVPSSDLIPFTSYSLERDMSVDDTVIFVKELPVDYHDTVFTYSGNGNAIRIGGEIIQYSRISREKPYAFLDCKRGAFGTKPSAHHGGEQADYLQQSYISFYPQPDSPLADALADRIADVFNAGGMDNIYFDGSEGMGSRYGIDAMRHKIFKRLTGNPLAEASCHGAHNWWVHSRMGAWDHPVWGAKRFHDEHIASAAMHRKADLLEPQLGWWAPREASAIARGHFLDEMEYFGCKNLGLDAAMSIQGVNVSHAPLPDGIETQVTLLGWYERLRLARYFDRKTLERIAEPGKEFRLRQDRSGQWKFTPVTIETRRIGTQKSTDQWVSNNRQGDQPLSFRLEALHAAAPNPSATPQWLAGEGDFPRFQASSPAPSVKLTIDETTEDPQEGMRNLRLKARNDSPAVKGAWTCATVKFPDPYRNLKGNAAFGVWIRGDGKDALLNFQLGTPREHLSALSDHHVKINFTGWRYFEFLLRERDTALIHDDVWPYGGHGGSHALYRNPVEMEHLSQLSIYLNNLPVGEDVEITLSPIKALTVHPVELKQPELDVNGTKLVIPFTLASGHYAELENDGSLFHYNERGVLQERVQIDPSRLPKIFQGENSVAYSCPSIPDGKARAEISINHFGESFGEVDRENMETKHMREEYDFPRRIISASGNADTWDIRVRPDEQATLAIEISGDVENPMIEIEGSRFAFPVKLEKDQRLVFRDGKQWTVAGNDRRILAQGSLAPPRLFFYRAPTPFGSTAANTIVRW